MSEYTPGDHLDSFRIEAVLFSGAMGQVYQAEDLLSGERVALKVPYGDILNNPLLYYHRQNEERISRFLHHPGIVRYLHRDRSRPYSITEFLEGKDLRSLLSRQAPFSIDRAGAVAAQIAEAISYLHSLGIIHHDIKPENIWVLPDDTIKLLDFGLAHRKGTPDLLAEDFTGPLGTPDYVSPEQLKGDRSDNRSDIYSLGLVLYEMLTGTLPYDCSSKVSKARERLKRDPVPPRRHRQDIPPQMQEVILRCLEIDPDRRYDTARALQASLASLEAVPVTRRGERILKPTAWGLSHSHPNRSRSLSIDPQPVPETSRTAPHILGAIIPDDISDRIIAAVKRQAILAGADITLLTVLEERVDDAFTAYQVEVEGEHFQARMDRYVQLLRRYNFDPAVRLITGDPSRVIVDTARRIGAGWVVLGPSGKSKLKKWFGATVPDRVKRKLSREVRIAPPEEKPKIPHPPQDRKLNRDELTDIELFFMDAWVFHLDLISRLTHGLLQDPDTRIDVNPHSCLLGRWIDQIDEREGREREGRTGILETLQEPHTAFHEAAGKMIVQARQQNQAGVKEIYLKQILPLSCRLKTAITEVNRYLRDRTDSPPEGTPPLSPNTPCPFFTDAPSLSGSVLEARAVRDYFCDHPDTSAEACLYTGSLPDTDPNLEG